MFCSSTQIWKPAYKFYKETADIVGAAHWISLILGYLSRTGILTILTLLFHKHDISYYLEFLTSLTKAL